MSDDVTILEPVDKTPKEPGPYYGKFKHGYSKTQIYFATSDRVALVFGHTIRIPLADIIWGNKVPIEDVA